MTYRKLLSKGVEKYKTEGFKSFLQAGANYATYSASSKIRSNHTSNRLFYKLKRRSYYRGSQPDEFFAHYPYRSYSIRGNPTFFGYYDVTPFDSSDSRMLSGYLSDQSLKVGYIDLNNDKFIEIGKTKTWSWQQGCRLRWLSEKKLIYNSMVGGSAGAIIHDISTNTDVKKLPHPVYSVAGKYGYSFDFFRLNTVRDGYGYETSGFASPTEKAPQDNGLFRINLESNSTDLLISLKELAKYESSPSMRNAFHWINHVFPNETSDQLMFLHRWANGNNWDTRLMVAKADGSKLSVVESTGEPSHMAWQTQSRILATVIHSDGTEYALYDVESNTKIGTLDFISINGHPTYSNNGQLLTDTNPNSIGERNLFLVKDDGLDPIATVFAPWMGGDRCDLHPRWNNSSTRVCVDSDHTGVRKMYIFDLTSKRENKLCDSTIAQ